MTCWRCSGAIGPMWLCGGTMNARCTTRGLPSASRQRDQRLADAEVGDRRLDVELRVGPERLGHRLDGLLIAGREGAQRVLHLDCRAGPSTVSGMSIGFCVTK